MRGYKDPEDEPKGPHRLEAVVIGASAGAFDALTLLLPSLPAGYPLPVLVVVHLPRDKESAIAELFAARCRVEVKEAEDKELIRGGVVYFAPPDYHLQVEPDRSLSLSSDEPVLFSRPSIDVLFETAADAYGPGLLGIILSGANSDGARGLRAVAAAGGTVFVQDPASAQAPTMPQAAQAASGAAAFRLEQIAAFLQSAGSVED